MQRLFDLDDQRAFARFSGDCNPMHVDRLKARRYMYGVPVVHGINAMLWALDEWARRAPHAARPASLNVRFIRPMKVDTPLHLRFTGEGTASPSIEIHDARTSLTRIRITLAAQDGRSSEFAEPVDGQPPGEPLLEPAVSAIRSASGMLELFLDRAGCTALFPHLERVMSRGAIASLLASTRLVGMRCPGLHSVYLELAVDLIDDATVTAFHYDAIAFDERFSLCTLAIRGPGLTGRIRALLRPAPRAPVDLEDLRPRIPPDAFAGQRALVVGGSRGIGEVTAKALSVGGAEVVVTYHRGKAEADALVAAIAAAGGEAIAVEFNALEPDAGAARIAAHGFSPTHVYYFATPFIFDGNSAGLDMDLCRTFFEFYVVGLHETVRRFAGEGLQAVYNPSSVAVIDLPPDMGEYATAKAASEMVATYLAKHHGELFVYSPRLPRTQTDQTATFLKVEAADPIDIVLRDLAVMQDRSLPRSPGDDA